MKIRRYVAVIVMILFVLIGIVMAQRGGSRPSPSVSRPAPVSRPPASTYKAPAPAPVKQQTTPSQSTKSVPTYSQPAPSERPMPKAPTKPLAPIAQTGDLKSAPVAKSYENKSFKQLSPSDQKLLRDAKANGTLFKSRDEAVTDFKSRYSSQYQSKFSSEPASRPAYIPQTYVSGGNTYNVIYNPTFGGYGYTNSLGAFIMYDAMSDAIMMNHLMNHHGYAHGIAPNAVHDDSGYGTALLIFLIFVVIVIVAIVFIRR